LPRLRPLRVALALVFALIAAPAMASDVFTVPDVAVEATAESAAAARDIALAKGQRDALTQLFQRLTVPEDAAKLPKVTDDLVARTVRGFQVDGEKTTPTTYRAKLRVTFRRDAVLEALGGAEVAYARPAERPIVVLPVWQTAGGPILWEEGNPWREAWLGRDGSADLVPLLVPSGDVEDLRTVDAAQAMNGDPVALAAIAQRYDSDTVLVIEARLTPDGTGLDLNVRRLGPSGSISVQDHVGLDAALADPAEQLRAAADEVAGRSEQETKSENLVPTGAPGSMPATVRVGSLQDWVTVRQRIATVPAVTRMDVTALATTDAKVVLHYVGDPAALAGAMASRGLALTSEPGGMVLALGPVGMAQPAATPTPGSVVVP
jgi:hypothetical protein